MIRNNQFNKIIAVLVLFCLFIQPMQVVSIMANETGNDVTLSLADGLITVTNRDYVQKSPTGTVVRTGTVAATGSLVLTGVQSNSWNITVTGTNVPVIRYRSTTTNGSILGAITGDLKIEIEGACNFNPGTTLTNATVTGTLRIAGVNEYNSINSLSLSMACDTVINNLNGNATTWKGLSISSTKNISLYYCNFPSTAGYGARIGNTAVNTSLVTIKDSTIGNIILQHAGNVMADNVIAPYDGSTSGMAITVGNATDGESIQILNSNIKVQHCTFNGPITKIINTRLEVTYPNYQGNIAFYGNNIIKGSTIVSPFPTSNSLHIVQTKSFVNDIVFYDSAAILAGPVSSRIRFLGSSGIVDPINTSSEKLYLNKLLVPGADSSQVTISIDGRDPVHLWTDKEGYLFLYLPAGTHNVKVLDFNGIDYYLDFDGATARESSVQSNVIGTLVPETPQTTIIFDKFTNKNFEYSFDYSTWKNGTTDVNGHFVIAFPNEIVRIYIKVDGKIYYANNTGSVSVIIAAKPLIISQSESDIEVLKGKSNTLYVTATPFYASDTINYTWYKNGIPISGEWSNTLTIANVTEAANGIYTCEVSESKLENSISTPITVTVIESQTIPVLKIIDQSSDRTVIKGYSTELYVLAQPDTATYEWYKDSERIVGENNRKITVIGTVTGSAIYNCVVTAEYGTVVSQPMTVSIIDNPLEDELLDLEGIKIELESQISSLSGQLSALQLSKKNLEGHIISQNDQITGLNSQITTLQEQLVKAQEELQVEGADKAVLSTQIQLLNNQIGSLQITINSLSIDLQENTNLKIILQQQMNSLNSEVHTLENQIIILNQTVLQKETENINLINQIMVLQEKVSDLQTNLSNLQSEVTVITEQNNLLIFQLQQLLLDKQTLDTLISNLKQQLLEANATIESLTNQVISLTAQLTVVIAEKSTIEDSLSELNKQIGSLINQITVLQVTINTLETQLSLSGEDTNELLQQISNLNNQINQLNYKLTQKQDQIDQLSNEKDLLQGKITNLEIQFVTLQDKVISLQENVLDKASEISSLLVNLTILQGNIHTLQSDLINLQQAKADVNNQLMAARTELNKLKSTLLSVKAELGINDNSEILPAIKSLKEQLAQQSNANTQLADQLTLVNQQLIEAQQSNERMQQTLEALQVLLEADNREVISLKIVELQTALTNSQSQILQLTQEKSKVTQQLEDANALIDSLQKQIADLLEVSGEDAKELIKQINTLKKEINNFILQNNSLQNQVKELSEKLVELNQDKALYQSDVIRLQTLLETTKSSLDDIREQLADSKAENSKLITESSMLMAENSMLKEENNTSKTENNKLKVELEELKKELEGLKKQVAAYEGTKPEEYKPQIPKSSDNQNSIELKEQLDKALAELKEVKKAQEETKAVNSVPESAVIVLPIDNMEAAPVAVKELSGNSNSEKVICTEFITAQNGWELAKDLKSNWHDKIKISDMTGTTSKPAVNKISFYAREKSKPQRVYEYAVVVENPVVLSVTPNFTMNKLIYLGSEFKLNLTELPNRAKVKFTTSDKKIATVSKEGKISAIKEGATIITGTVTDISNPYKFTVNVTVKENNHKTLNLKEETLRTSSKGPILTVYKLVEKGQKTKVTLAGAEEAVVTYISSDSSIVTVSSDGIIKGNKKGYATVTAILAQDGAIYSYIIRVRVTDGTKDINMWSYLTVA